MRLIDADKLTDALNLWGCYKHENPKAYDTLMLYEILGAIENQPTAYDVDKVCEELDWAIYPYSLFDVDNCELTESLLKADMVESIVRRGGVDG